MTNRGSGRVLLATLLALLTGVAQYLVARATVLTGGPSLSDPGYYTKTIGEIAAMWAVCLVSFAAGCLLLRVRAWFGVALGMLLVEAVVAGAAWHYLHTWGAGRFLVIAAILIGEYLIVAELRRPDRGKPVTMLRR